MSNPVDSLIVDAVALEHLCLLEDERDAAIVRQHAAEAERDEALTKLARAEDVAHWSEKVMDEANERCAALRRSAKSARWHAVYGSMVAGRVLVHSARSTDLSIEDITKYSDDAVTVADQAEEAWEKNRETKA